MSGKLTQRTTVYVDGFNLYYGLRADKLKDCYWLNVVELARRLAGADRHLTATKYFTSRVSGAPHGSSPKGIQRANEKRGRQSDYLEALETIAGLEIVLGKFLSKDATCYDCGHLWTKYEEKMTDVNIATCMLSDAFQDKFDTAILISGDSDLVPPIREIRRLFPTKQLIVTFPPARHSYDLREAATSHRQVKPHYLRLSQLANPVTSIEGRAISKPTHWT